MVSYEFKTNTNEKTLLNNGFKARGKYYTYRTNLFKDLITLNILIDRDNMEVSRFDVYDESNNEPYIPFYYNKYCANNKVLDLVQINYDTVMIKLVKAGIFIKAE